MENLWAFQDVGLDRVWFEIDVQIPLLYFFGVRDHSVELLDAGDSLVRLLEQTLSDVSHDLLVLSYLGRDAHQGAQFRRQVNILAFLSNFEKWLINGVYFDTISS